MSETDQPIETQQQVYEWQRQYKTVSMELDQARFEIEALQRRLNEYATSHQQCQLELHNLKVGADQNNEALKEMAATLLATTQDCAAMRSALEQVRAHGRPHGTISGNLCQCVFCKAWDAVAKVIAEGPFNTVKAAEPKTEVK